MEADLKRQQKELTDDINNLNKKVKYSLAVPKSEHLINSPP
jgi:hypothetical protein